jgi:hypothetical protein
VVADDISLQECDLGVISNILTLQAQVQATDALYEMARLLKPMLDIRPILDLSGPDFELDQIHKALGNAKGSSNSKNRFHTILQQLSTAVSAEMLKVGRPRLRINMDAKEIALSLEVKFVYHITN